MLKTLKKYVFVEKQTSFLSEKQALFNVFNIFSTFAGRGAPAGIVYPKVKYCNTFLYQAPIKGRVKYGYL